MTQGLLVEKGIWSLSISILMIGAILLGISSCATAPAKPLSTGELRLLSISIPEKEKIKVHVPFVVSLQFEADGDPEIKQACFYFSGEGPRCFKVTDVNYGSTGRIRVQIHTNNAGTRLLECYVLYIRDGKIQPTNRVSTYFRMTPQ